MGHLVRVVVGDWRKLAPGTWKFNADDTEVKYDVVVRENETYESVVEMVRKKFGVLPYEPVALTYDFPQWMKAPGATTTAPVDIVEDGDVELFMAMRMDFVDLQLCVAYGEQDVGEYRIMREEEFGTCVVPPKPIPWRGENLSCNQSIKGET